MINFRFHLASLIGVFLALALGVVIGSTVVDRAVVDNLNHRIDTVERNSHVVRAENKKLQDDLDRVSEAVLGLEPYALDGALTARSVGIIAVRGVDDHRVDALVDATKAAGATLTGVLWLEPKWHASSDADARALGTLIGDPTRRGAALRDAAWRQLAARASSSAPANRANDLLVALTDAKFAQYDALGASDSLPSRFGVRGLLTILVIGDGAQVPEKETVTAAGDAFVATKSPLLVADMHASDSTKERGDALKPIRSTDLALSISTVDNLDRPEGPAVVVLALADLDRGTVGHYGYGPGTKLVPERATSP